MNKNAEAFNRLVDIMAELREKCPWDKAQTVQTLRQMTLEETYELTDAISDNNWNGIKEELGDLLLHIVFYSRIATEQAQFTIADVIDALCEKLIYRHPHIYGNVQVSGEADVKKNWEALKLKEGKRSVLSGVPKALPSLLKAMRLQEKAAQVGFDWKTKEPVWEKVEEELAELKEAIEKGNQQQTEEEFGDVLFSLINFARFIKVDAENALELTNKKFANRVTQMEEKALKKGSALSSLTLEEMDLLWNEIKQERI